MNKTLIRLTESDLHRIVKESVKRVLNEGYAKEDKEFAYEKGQEAIRIIRKGLEYVDTYRLGRVLTFSLGCGDGRWVGGTAIDGNQLDANLIWKLRQKKERGEKLNREEENYIIVADISISVRHIMGDVITQVEKTYGYGEFEIRYYLYQGVGYCFLDDEPLYNFRDL